MTMEFEVQPHRPARTRSVVRPCFYCNTSIDNIADPRELFLTPLCDTRSLITLGGTVPVADMSGATTVRDNLDGYYIQVSPCLSPLVLLAVPFADGRVEVPV